jgi:hypothetical protein
LSAALVVLDNSGGATGDIAAKLKHLEFIQGVIARMATHFLLFKGWAITIAAALSAFAAVDSKQALLAITLVSTIMFWGLDAYLWLERCFRKLYQKVALTNPADINFAMEPDKIHPRRQWLLTCERPPHLWFFYGSIIAIEIVGMVVMRSR